MTTGWIIAQIKQQILYIFLCVLDILQREDVVLIEIQLVIDVLQYL
jgi:hypothetical protein